MAAAFLHKIWHGLTRIKQSVQLVMAHPILLAYPVSSFAILYVILRAFQTSKYSIESHMEALIGNYQGDVNALTSYTNFTQYYTILIALVTCISLFFLACIAHHAMHILQKEPHSIGETFAGVVRRLPTLSLWFIFKIITGLSLITMLFPAPAGVIVFLWFLCIAIINFVTSLVLPILAIEQTGIITAVKRSWHLVYQFFMVFIGIFLLFNLLGMSGSMLLNVFVQQLEILTYTIFYYEYYARPRPELAGMFSQDV